MYTNSLLILKAQDFKNKESANSYKLHNMYLGFYCTCPSGESFDADKAEMYSYETLGGNNSREALQALSMEEGSNPIFRTRLVSVYSGLTDDEAIRLAAKHNKTTSFYHEMSTWNKVKIAKLYFYKSDTCMWVYLNVLWCTCKTSAVSVTIFRLMIQSHNKLGSYNPLYNQHKQ